MREIFKIDGLRHLQPAAVECALKRQSQLIIMATGGGKSLCFQLPAVVLGGTTIVVSPLIALMADQSQALLDKGIAAAVISSSNGEGKNLDVMERLLGRSLRAKQKLDPSTLRPVTLLYCTPEQIQTNRFQNILMELHQKNRLALFAIDEAHCLSSWGHDFRPAYRKLGWLRQSFPDVPCMACTATATPKVIQDIRETLRLQDCPCHMGSFDRVNIRYRVRYKDALDQSSERGAKGDLLDFIQREHDRAQRKKTVYSGIVYVHKRSDTTDLAKEITKATGIIAAAYHGGLKVAERERVQQSWTSGETNIAIATVAFGMGIDLAHVRYVVHWSMAKSIEAFYQESGRAGRDGLGSTSVLYFSKSDADKFAYLVNKQKGKKSKNKNDKSATHALEDLQRMIDYCITPGCRRKCLLQHFGERNVDPKTVCKGKCDFCKDPKGVEEAIEAATAENDFTFHTKPKPETKWDGQWESPFGDDDPTSGEVDNDWEVDGLDITGARQFGEENTSNSQHKPSAAAVLSKFEVSVYWCAAPFLLYRSVLCRRGETHTSSILCISNIHRILKTEGSSDSKAKQMGRATMELAQSLFLSTSELNFQIPWRITTRTRLPHPLHRKVQQAFETSSRNYRRNETIELKRRKLALANDQLRHRRLPLHSGERKSEPSVSVANVVLIRKQLCLV